jgi:uncharacterized membrane protein
MRAFAVLMMVQGHTIDALLSNEFRDYNHTGYYIWHTFRGFTAPTFMFISGVVFTYLLRLNPKPFFYNPRVQKGFIRFLTLIIIGYLLRFPTYNIFGYYEVTHAQWMGFFKVDALHLIGCGILIILIVTYLAEEFKINHYIAYIFSSLLLFSMIFITEQINWSNFLPIPFAAYFYTKTGSFFPIFPWAGYVLAGAVFGNYLVVNPDSFSKRKFSILLISIGIISIVLAELFNYYVKVNNLKTALTVQYYYIIERTGYVILLNGLMSLLAQRLKKIPEIFKQIGTHTLLIYAVHIVILYGSAWIPGVSLFLSKSFSFGVSIFAAVCLISLMVLMVFVIEKRKSRKRAATIA